MTRTSAPDLMMFPRRDPGEPEALWAALGLDEAPSSRDRIVALTMIEVARVGPAAFNTRTICAQLGLTHPVIQYHFGSRDALIAEAAHATYVRFVDRLEAAVEAAPHTPVDRLRAALRAGVELAREIRGWGAVLNYFPFYSETVAEVLAEQFQERHTQQYERNLALLLRLVVDVWEDSVSEPPAHDARAEADARLLTVLADPDAMVAFSRLSFAAHGLSVWRAGHVAVDEPTGPDGAVADVIVSRTIEDLIDDVLTRRPTSSEHS